jgi:hypothetical protein
MNAPSVEPSDLRAALFHFNPRASEPSARELAAALARAHPRMAHADPAGRGASAQPCQWIADLVALSMASVNVKDAEGRLNPVGGASRAWFLALAAELSRDFKPGRMLAFDGKEPIDSLPLGRFEGQFNPPALSPYPDLLEALVGGPHASIPAPGVGSSVADLIERCLEGVQISTARARQAIDTLVRRGHYESSYPVEKFLPPADMRRAVEAILDSAPGLGLDDLGWKPAQRAAWLGEPSSRPLLKP